MPCSPYLVQIISEVLVLAPLIGTYNPEAESISCVRLGKRAKELHEGARDHTGDIAMKNFDIFPLSSDLKYAEDHVVVRRHKGEDRVPGDPMGHMRRHKAAQLEAFWPLCWSR